LKKNRIIFRADGSAGKGYGHVIRLLSLASMLNKKYICIFIIQQPDDFLKKQITSICDSIMVLPLTTKFKNEATQLSKILDPEDIFVLDSYHTDIRYQSLIKKKCFKLVFIDDLHNQHFIADAVINHSEGIDKKKYSVEPYTQVYLGTPYAILRKSFLNNAVAVHPIPKNNIRIFINMGGSDQHNYSRKAVSICLQNKFVTHVDVVLGSFYPYLQELKELAGQNKQISIALHSNLSEKKMCLLMKKSHAAICSASTVSYEYASVGGLLFVYKTADNQKNIHAFLLKSQVAFDVKQFDTKLKEQQNSKPCEAYFKNRSFYFNGKSDKNILSIFERFEIQRGVTMRKAGLADVHIYYNWANEKEVRKNSVNQGHIEFVHHTKWFASKLKAADTELFFFEKNGSPLGQVRFDKEKDKAEIGYSIDPKFRGKGYGEVILSKAIDGYSKSFPKTQIVAKVRETNVASNRVFIKLGFKELQPVVISNDLYKKYVLSAANRGHAK
jgi:UDP-2,4-diacetamido-2,4,6-trideoxy-beta-L-altropyranose hydrolase